MNVKIKAFSVFTDILGKESLLEIPNRETITVKELIDILLAKYSGLRELFSKVEYVLLVNGKKAGKDHVLFDGDEIALLPPASGGL